MPRSINYTNFNRVHPIGFQEGSQGDGNQVPKNYYISMSGEELEDRGINGCRRKLATAWKDLGVGYLSSLLVVLYALYVLTWLAIESEFYSSNTTVTVLEIIELVVLWIFSLEIFSFLFAFGPKLYFRDLLNFVEILVIIALIATIILDLLDRDDFRVEGLFRWLRVTLAFFRLRIMAILYFGRRKSSAATKSVADLDKVKNILSSLKGRINEAQYKSELNFCLKILDSEPSQCQKEGEAPKKPAKKFSKKQDSLSWARDNSVRMNSARGLLEKRKDFKNKLSQSDILKEIGINSKAKEILKDVNQMSFDIFALSRETNGNELVVCSTYIMEKHNLFEECMIDPKTFSRFVESVQTGYHEIAYHNKIHGMDVGRLAYYYSTNCDLIEKAQLDMCDVAALVIGGFIHDFDHLGWNNAYLIETQHTWAVTYNDISVWENHHVAAAYDLIQNKPGWNIFENMNLEEFREWRKMITKMIIATDMALHFDYIKNFKNLVNDEEVDLSKKENKMLVTSMWLHVSDLTNPTKLWDESYKWTLLVYEEFFVQGDHEKELGLPIGDLNDRKSINLAKSQLGFIDFIVQPTFEAFSLLLPKVKVHIDQGKANRAKWSSMIKEWDELKDRGNFLIKEFKKAEKVGEKENDINHADDNKRTADVPEAFN